MDLFEEKTSYMEATASPRIKPLTSKVSASRVPIIELKKHHKCLDHLTPEQLSLIENFVRITTIYNYMRVIHGIPGFSVLND